MVGISGIGVIGVVATVTSVRRTVIITVVAYRTIIANGRVRPVQRVIIVVNRECRRLPARGRRVAHGAIRRDGKRYVVGIGARIVIRRVTTGTSVGRVVIIALVACVAIIGNGNMCTGEGINGAVVKS